MKTNSYNLLPVLLFGLLFNGCGGGNKTTSTMSVPVAIIVANDDHVMTPISNVIGGTIEENVLFNDTLGGSPIDLTDVVARLVMTTDRV